VTDFDLIGISYYRKWSKQSLSELGDTLARLHERYRKQDILLVETAYPWTLQNADSAPNLLGKDSLIEHYPRDAV
jgi:arabinogalactan endo-1,4-beta-galactosidase